MGNVFFKSAANGIFMNGGAGHVIEGNVFLEGRRGVYNQGASGAKLYRLEQEIAADPGHRYRHTKENYIGRAEREIGKEGWLEEPFRSRYPTMVEVLEDRGEFGRLWPIRCTVRNNCFHGNRAGDRTLWSRMPEPVLRKSVLEGDRVVGPEDFADYRGMDFRFRSADLPSIPFESIGLVLDRYRTRVPVKAAYRQAISRFYEGIDSMPGTRRRLDTARLIEEGPWIGPPGGSGGEGR
ncbi:MAG: hypothetical protein Fur0037_16770 [Planctomycetota bacterium]